MYNFVYMCVCIVLRDGVSVVCKRLIVVKDSSVCVCVCVLY